MKTLRKCKWEEIEVGEVFACNGCWEIFQKTSNTCCLFLAEDEQLYWDGSLGEQMVIGEHLWWSLRNNCYKLSKVNQNKWLNP